MKNAWPKKVFCRFPYKSSVKTVGRGVEKLPAGPAFGVKPQETKRLLINFDTVLRQQTMAEQDYWDELDFLGAQVLEHLNYLNDLGAPGVPLEFKAAAEEPGGAENRSAKTLEALKPDNQVGSEERPAGSTLKTSLRWAPCQKCPMAAIEADFSAGPFELLIIADDLPLESQIYFQDEAGQLLANIIEKGFKTPLETVGLAPLRRCVENDNDVCKPFILNHFKAARPKVIVTMGAEATRLLLSSSKPLDKLRGRWANWQEVPLMPTHAAGKMLLNPDLKKETWADIKKILAYLDSLNG